MAHFIFFGGGGGFGIWDLDFEGWGGFLFFFSGEREGSGSRKTFGKVLRSNGGFGWRIRSKCVLGLGRRT